LALWLSALWQEHRKVQELAGIVRRARREMIANYQRVESLNADPYLDDDDGIATGLYWETYFGPDKTQHNAEIERSRLAEQLAQQSIARAAAAGALLQYAKQAISQCHGKYRENAPAGDRTVAGQPLRDVIWEGRNQSEHWDEGQFSASVDKVFGALDVHFGGRFTDYKAHKNKAFDVVDVLGWHDLPPVERDLLSLS
jgi:hypothetical protein